MPSLRLLLFGEKIREAMVQLQTKRWHCLKSLGARLTVDGSATASVVKDGGDIRM